MDGPIRFPSAFTGRTQTAMGSPGDGKRSPSSSIPFLPGGPPRATPSSSPPDPLQALLAPSPDGPWSLSTNHHVRIAGPSGVGQFISFLQSHLAESGHGETPRFAVGSNFDWGKLRNSLLQGWQQAIREPRWVRTWLLFNQEEDRIIGYAEVRGGKFDEDLHRAALAMGIDTSSRRAGLGRGLLQKVVDWAHYQNDLQWLDLTVFSSNQAARRLYATAGFVESGIRRDAYRFSEGETVDEISMSLRLS